MSRSESRSYSTVNVLLSVGDVALAPVRACVRAGGRHFEHMKGTEPKNSWHVFLRRGVISSLLIINDLKGACSGSYGCCGAGLSQKVCCKCRLYLVYWNVCMMLVKSVSFQFPQ